MMTYETASYYCARSDSQANLDREKYILDRFITISTMQINESLIS